MRTILLLVMAAIASAQPKKIVAVGLAPAELEVLKAVSPAVTIEVVRPGELMEKLPGADAFWGQNITAEMLRAAPKLKWMQTYSAGVEQVLAVPEFKNSNITLTNAKIVMGPNIADHAFALLLSITRGTAHAAAKRATEDWRQLFQRPVELNGKTAVIVGVGGIGQQIAQRAHAFGMHVIGVDPEAINVPFYVERLVTPDRIDEVMPLADVLFISAPHTPKSEGMIGPRQFELMKKDSYFIAVSRGKLYNTPALVKALDSRKLAGAGLDVTDPEPLPPGHPLWKFDNVVITPHSAGQGDVMPSRRLEVLKENVRRFGSGQPLMNVVDKQKGY
jgi:phosphoglycerate dehydrogenase-like enzyme